jgi:hypothetical protein
MERNSSGALRAPSAFGAIGTSDHHVTLSGRAPHITHVFRLAAALRLRPSAAAPLTTRPPAAPAPLPSSGHCHSPILAV